MGVPALFRWLSQKYPKIISNVIEDTPVDLGDGQIFPVDITKVNPNGEEFDNLYLDMNGIVHPCSHPDDKPAPATEEEMMLEIFKYTDRVVNMVRPRKLLMIAVVILFQHGVYAFFKGDGVAPRAKMNQQRSRRFRSVKEAKEKDENDAEFAKLLKKQGTPTSAEDAVKKTWDSNAITPGTPFMHILALSLRYWCAYKLNEDPGWAKVKVIISDASVPGEGEHKIMEFIRSQRRSQDHDPNTRHVIYGLDADLIMLGLATHEPYFRVLREDVFFQDAKAKGCRICGQVGHYAADCRGTPKEKQGEYDEKGKTVQLKPFIWLHVSILREYLEAELFVPNQPFRFDLERALDDWVFMCFFVGNDFLPHLPSLEIREQGIDTLINIWREAIPIMGGYVTKDGHVNMERAQKILEGLAKQEDGIFRRRKANEDRMEANARRRKLEQERRANGSGRNGPNRANGSHNADNSQAVYESGPILTHDAVVNRKAEVEQANVANKSAAAVLREQLRNRSNAGGASQDSATEDIENTDATPEPSSVLGKRKAGLFLDDDPSTPGRSTPETVSVPNPNEPPQDTVRLWEEGYGDRYYEQKFHADPKDLEFRHQVARHYVEGLCWVLLYYFQGCPSWTWYYPYHYAPFAADFVGLDKMELKFEKGKPFRPYEQLMGVLPAASNHTIPVPFRDLMSNPDSDIIDFYPEDFQVDLNGKKFAWQGVALLPFIDEKRLLDAMATKYDQLTEDEKERNEPGHDTLLFSTLHPLFEEVSTTFYGKKQGAPMYKLNPKISEGLSGKVEKNENYIPESPLTFPLENGGMPDLSVDQSISVNYEMPKSISTHKSMLLRGVKFPTPALDAGDIQQVQARASRGPRQDRDRRSGGRFENGNYGDAMAPRADPKRRRSDGPPNGGGSNLNPSNPFAAFINPNFNPTVVDRAPPPPHMVAASGWVPPPPEAFAANGYPPMPPGGGYGDRSGGYNGRGQSGGGYHNGGYSSGRQNSDRYNGGGHSNGGYGGRGYDRSRNQ